MLKQMTEDRAPSLVAFYDIQSGNKAGLFFQSRSLHGENKQ